MEPKMLVLQYLDEAHATETALVTNLRAHGAMTTDGPYRRLLERHLAETQQQVKNIDRRRAQLGGKDGRGIVATAAGLIQDAVGQALVLTKGPIDMVRTMSQPERMLKNARDECATEALEIAIYDMLEAAAKAAGDDVTARLAADHRKEEERMLRDLRDLLPRLALQTVEDKTGVSAAGSSSSSRSTTTRRSSSGRATGATTRRSSSTAGKASAAKRPSSSSSRSKSATTSRSSSSRSTGGSSTTRKRSTAKKS